MLLIFREIFLLTFLFSLIQQIEQAQVTDINTEQEEERETYQPRSDRRQALIQGQDHQQRRNTPSREITYYPGFVEIMVTQQTSKGIAKENDSQIEQTDIQAQDIRAQLRPVIRINP